ncbi:MAG: hypothetical protein HGB10_03075 [Coriobacteriia bacterium]|nr:hypothetical protein [Coriobacteriia bacterium]
MEAFASQLTSGSLGTAAVLGVAFLGGVVAGFGPCVLPMLPAVFGYVTGQVGDSTGVTSRPAWLRGLGLSAVFVIGMSLVLACIGAAAAILGRALLVGAWAYYLVAAVCVLLGLHMLGLIRIPFDRLNHHLPLRRPESRGVIGAFVLGVLFAAVASPCSTPILAAIATIAATRGSVVQGALLLFVYGLGKGVPLLLLGLVSGSVTLMRAMSNTAGVFSKIGGAALIVAAAYLVWLA